MKSNYSKPLVEDINISITYLIKTKRDWVHILEQT